MSAEAGYFPLFYAREAGYFPESKRKSSSVLLYYDNRHLLSVLLYYDNRHLLLYACIKIVAPGSSVLSLRATQFF